MCIPCGNVPITTYHRQLIESATPTDSDSD